MWSLLTLVATVNMVFVPSAFAASIILINVSIMASKYQEHKSLRAEYDIRYPPTFNKSTHEPEETEQEER